MSVWSQTNYWDRLFIAFAVDNNLKLDGLSEYFQASNPFLGKTDEWLLWLCSRRHWRHDTPQCSVIHSLPGCCESCELEATLGPGLGPNLTCSLETPDSCHQSSDLDVIIIWCPSQSPSIWRQLGTWYQYWMKDATQTVSFRSKLRDLDLRCTD